MVKLTTHVTADHKAALELISESAGKHASEAAVLRMALDRGLPVLQLQGRARRRRPRRAAHAARARSPAGHRAACTATVPTFAMSQQSAKVRCLGISPK